MPEHEPRGEENRASSAEPAEEAASKLTPEQEAEALRLGRVAQESFAEYESSKDPAALQRFKGATEELLALLPPSEEPRERAEGEPGEISSETLKANQEMYDFLGIEVNLQEECEKGNILTPSPEQKEAAREEGYTLELIVLGNMPREEVLGKVNQTFAQEFEPADGKGVWYSNRAETDKTKTEAAQTPSRPTKPYLMLLKPQTEISEAHPETINKTFPACLEILKEENQKNPSLKLKGLMLSEYLFAQTLVYHEDKKRNPQTTKEAKSQTNAHLEKNTWTWLLEESIVERGQPTRCLIARWGPVNRQVLVDSDEVQDSSSDEGARFAAVP